jgi:hypothetical protein
MDLRLELVVPGLEPLGIDGVRQREPQELEVIALKIQNQGLTPR